MALDVAHAGAMAGEGPEDEPQELWRFSVDEQIDSVHVSERGLDVGVGGKAYRLNPRDGSQVLDMTLQPTEPGSTVDVTEFGHTLYSDSSVVLSSVDQFGNVAQYDMSTGEQTWNVFTDYRLIGLPVVSDEAVYSTSGRDNEPIILYAVDRRTGTQAWEFRLPEEDYFGASTMFGVVALHGGTGFATLGEHQVYYNVPGAALFGLSKTTGKQCWRWKEGAFSGSAAYDDGALFVTDIDHRLYSLDGKTGAENWKASGMSGQSSPAVANGVVYVGGDDGSLYAFGARSGDKKWSFEAGAFQKSEPVVAGDTVYALSDDGTLYAIATATGTLKWSTAAGSPSLFDPRPVVGEGSIFVVDETELMAFG